MEETSNCSDKKDEELIPLVLQDGDFYLCLMKRYETKILSYILRISGLSREDAEDVLQDVFIKAYTNLNDFDTSLKFSSWIYRIAHNQVVSNFRKLKARPQAADIVESDKLLERIASEIDIEDEVDRRYLAENIGKILSKLDKKYREVLVLKFLEEKDYQEISDILQKPKGTVAALLNRAKTKFREAAEEHNIKF